MKPQRLLLAAIALATLLVAFVGISAYTEGDPIPVLTLFLTGATPILTAIAVLLKDQKVERTLEVSVETDKKVDHLLNGSLVGKVDRLEVRVDEIGSSVEQILDVLTRPSSESSQPRTD